ncbi:MAG: hypothetical protein M1830_002302 [Pleopsidium flavum]|nr:MAG: hypothetical protein M1830_002323 [Pleopsidium flavum]KAI9871909.1 MAG: hypothetical protein M1830_002302 [Pleopsidium flavum]
MADPLYELLAPYFDTPPSPRPIPSVRDLVTSRYLDRLSTLPLTSLTSIEAQSLAQSSHSIVLSLQALTTRSHKSVIASSDHLSNLRTELPLLAVEAEKLQNAIPALNGEASLFSSMYSKSVENTLLDRRKKALLLARNADRMSDLLDLPTLLSSAIASSAGTSGSSASSATASYSSALDLNAHIKRLRVLYPDSQLVKSIFDQAEEVMQGMTTNLIITLRTQGIKLAAGMRTIGWLRRVAPELNDTGGKHMATMGGQEVGLGSLFLVCRLANLVLTLEALEPLRELADQESERRLKDKDKRKEAGNAWSGGQQTEKYLKRYIEIFREQSFAIISMYKSIFPSSTMALEYGDEVGAKHPSLQLKPAIPKGIEEEVHDPFRPLPSTLSTFPLHLVDILVETLKRYLPNVRDHGSRESLLTQVLYCAGSLGRLGGDFSMVLSSLEDTDESEDEPGEWIEVTKKHRELAGRLELLASGVRDRKTSAALPKNASLVD